jgi:hypothetical protein
MYCIIKHVWAKNIGNVPNVWLAYAISICEIMLNPEIQKIQVSENEIKLKMSRNSERLVSLKLRKVTQSYTNDVFRKY